MPNWLVGKERQLVDFTVVYAHRGERTLCRSAEILLPKRLPGCRIPGTKSAGLPDAWRGSISKLDFRDRRLSFAGQRSRTEFVSPSGDEWLPQPGDWP